jgi:hypothetical protein
MPRFEGRFFYRKIRMIFDHIRTQIIFITD